jgi:hypothetical protein
MSAHDDDEAPLGPAQERLRRKLVRLLFVSGGIMMLGLIAVFAAIVYRLGDQSRALKSPDGAAAFFSAEAPVEGRIAVPPGYRLIGATLDGERALLTLAAPDGSSLLLLVDLKTGAALARHRLVAE